MKRYMLNNNWQLQDESGQYSFSVTLPCQVHDALLDEGIIENPNITGINKDCWIGERVWKYSRMFELPTDNGIWNLQIKGIDTYADIILNGEKIGESVSAYQSVYLANLKLEKVNKIEIIIYPPEERIRQMKVPTYTEEKVQDYNKARVFRSGFQEFSGPKPNLIRMGIYGDIILENAVKGGFQNVCSESVLNSRLDEGKIKTNIEYYGDTDGKELKWEITYNGVSVKSGRLPAVRNFTVICENPKLWYPRTHGKPDVYQFRIEMLENDCVIDEVCKQIGFRRIEQADPIFKFRINGKPLKLYGACLAHPDTKTGCYQRVKEKLYGLLDLAEMAHFNVLRVWGESEILDDDFYDECDRRGILLWQDFYMGWGMYNEEESLLPIFESEAIELVKRLKHHPSILLWCGGNENYWSRDWVFPNEYCYGEKIFGDIYPAVVRKYDPERYYHVNSPAGGDFANDPLGGDTHGYTHIWYVPGRMYPEFLSENCRVSAPEMKTMKRMMMEEELWPANYVNTYTKRNSLSWPTTWSGHNTNDGHVKLGPVEHYMDAESPEELIYRLGEAHSEYLKGQIEGFRRGKPLDDPIGRRRCHGHILWKFNNNSNIISYGVVDYFNEPLRAYYELKRLYEPLQVSFSIEDKISVWVVNDTLEDISGKLEIKRINLKDSTVADKKTVFFTCEKDDSIVAANLNSFGQFLKNSVLVATAYTLDGKVVSQNMAFPQPERWMTFPSEGNLKASVEGNVLTISSDVFARSVSLEGDDDGDAFGWRFEDNFFNLIPGEEKKVRFFGDHKKGKIRIQPYYWSSEDGIEIEI